MIETWLDYAPSDLLLFSEDVYRRLFVRANAAARLWSVVATSLLLLVSVAAAVSRRWAPVLPLALAAGWVGSAAALLPLYGEVNWAVPWVAPLFWIEAVGLTLVARRAGRGGADGSGHWMAPAAVAAAALAHPTAELAVGRASDGLQLFGIAPDPTALATLAGLAVLPGLGAARVALAAIPLLWSLASAGVLLTLGATVEGAALGLAAVALTFAMVRGRRG